jgi:predicted Zn-dependent peptidase
VGTREENLAECLRIAAAEIEDIATQGPRPEELERAKENLKGRIMLSMEATSNRMSRLGKSLITDSELLDLDRILAEIEAVDEGAVAQLAEVVLPPDALSVAAIGTSEKRFLEAVAPVCPALVERAAA